MLDPLAKRLVIAQRPPNTESKVAGVRVYKTRGNAAITAMAMNQRQFIRTHLPGLLQYIAKNSVEHDFTWMVAVKVDLHFSSKVHWDLAAKQGVRRKTMA